MMFFSLMSTLSCLCTLMVIFGCLMSTLSCLWYPKKFQAKMVLALQ